MLMTKTKNSIKTKTAAVKDVLAYEKHVTKRVMEKIAKSHNLTRAQLTNALLNYSNFGRVDKRVRRGHHDVTVEVSRKSLNNVKKARSWKTKDYSRKEAGILLHEYIFAPERKTVVSFCNSHKLNINQFYAWFRELQIYGKLLGKRVFNFNKYGKYDIYAAVRLHRQQNLTNAHLKSCTWSKGLSVRKVTKTIGGRKVRVTVGNTLYDQYKAIVRTLQLYL